METNTRYLTLALDVRLITDVLIDFVEEKKELPDPNDLLAPLLMSLNDQSGSSVKALSDMRQFGTYESLKTISDVFGRDEKRELIRTLKAVLDQSRDDRQASALRAIELLDSLESTALYHYEHPGPGGRIAYAG